MIPAMTPDPDPCDALSCDMQDSPVEVCRKRGCGFRWRKEARLDREDRERKDGLRCDR